MPSKPAVVVSTRLGLMQFVSPIPIISLGKQVASKLNETERKRDYLLERLMPDSEEQLRFVDGRDDEKSERINY